jgi:hypothetical protein
LLYKHFVPPKGGTPTNVEVLGRWNTKHEHLVSMLRGQGRQKEDSVDIIFRAMEHLLLQK